MDVEWAYVGFTHEADLNDIIRKEVVWFTEKISKISLFERSKALAETWYEQMFHLTQD